MQRSNHKFKLQLLQLLVDCNAPESYLLMVHRRIDADEPMTAEELVTISEFLFGDN